MNPRLVLEPNFGAEDDRPLSVVDPALCAGLALTWALLFDGRAEVHGAAPTRPDWIVDDSAALGFLEGASGLIPWLSTTEAHARAAELGLRCGAPSPALTAKIGDKAWALEVARELRLLPPPLQDVLTVLDSAQLAAPHARALVDERLATWPTTAAMSFTLKPRFGSSGRGRVKGRGGRLDDDGARGLSRLARRGGAVLEPWLQRTDDLSAQLFIDDGGAVSLLGLTRQLASASGVWLGNALVLEEDGRLHSGSPFDDEVARAARLVAERAAEEGFRGPLGVDAFAYQPRAGGPVLRPVVEVNARFTMGLVTLGLARRAEAIGKLRAGGACCYRPRLDDVTLPAGVERLELPAGALYLGRDYDALSPVLSTGGRPKRR